MYQKYSNVEGSFEGQRYINLAQIDCYGSVLAPDYRRTVILDNVAHQ